MFPNDDLINNLPKSSEHEELVETLLDELETWLASPDFPPAWLWRIAEDAFAAEPFDMVLDLLRDLQDPDDEDSIEELRGRFSDQIHGAAPDQIWAYEVIRRMRAIVS